MMSPKVSGTELDHVILSPPAGSAPEEPGVVQLEWDQNQNWVGPALSFGPSFYVLWFWFPDQDLLLDP